MCPCTQNADMKSEDPMCWQAIQADPNVIWNWNGPYRENVAGNHEGTLPDGQLCSGGETDPRYAALDVPGPWTTTALDNDFTLTYNDAANHGADYYRVYVTKQGFDPTTDELGWGDLELVTETDVIAPGAGTPSPTAAPTWRSPSAPRSHRPPHRRHDLAGQPLRPDLRLQRRAVPRWRQLRAGGRGAGGPGGGPPRGRGS